MKPRVLVDVKTKFRKSPEIRYRLNLSRRAIRIPIKRFTGALFILASAVSLVLGSAVAPTSPNQVLNVSRAAQNSGNDTERQALEAQLSQLEKEITQHEAALAQYKQQGKTLSGEIKRLEAKISKLNLQIRAINLNLEKLDTEISDTETQISQTETQIDLNKKSISMILQSVRENDQNSLIFVLLKNPQLSDFFGDLNNMLAVQDNLRGVVIKIKQMRNNLIDQKTQLALERSDTQSLKDYQATQKQTIESTKSEKSNLLQATKGKESEYQKLVTEKKKSAAEIRKQIFTLIGGGELEFDEAYKLAKLASDATGVRPALILAVLDKESALGKNVGSCNYKTAMNPNRDIPPFLEIIQQLGLIDNLDNGILKVSCPNSDGLYGGAMGPAQFLPSVWMLYKDRVGEISGDNPPSPWKNSDAFIATALYLKDSGAANATIAQERIAAARYYAGSRWRRYLWTYGDRVVTRAQQFQDDINILNG